MAARGAAGADEAVGQDAALQVASQFAIRVAGYSVPIAFAFARQREVGLQVLLDEAVENGVLGVATGVGRDATATDAPAHATTPAPSAAGARTARYYWAILLARLFATFPLLCPQCCAPLRLIAFVTAAEPVARILTPLGEPSEPPHIAPARRPPAWDDLLEPLPDWDAIVQPAPEFQFDQRISW